MITPDHIDVQVNRIPLPEEQWPYEDELELFSKFHATGLMVGYAAWGIDFTLVCLMDGRSIDHLSVTIDDVHSSGYMEAFIDEVIKFHRGKILALTIHLTAGSAKVDVGQEMTATDMESKFVITIPLDGNILVSGLHRNAETKEIENDGKWVTSTLDNTTLDPSGELRRMFTEFQTSIKEAREKNQ